MASDIGRKIRGQKQDGASDLVGTGMTLERYGLGQLLGDVDAEDPALLLFDACLESVIDRSGIDRIDPDVAPGQRA
jgi:hypothetical protein